jgi:hypothetical protein
VIRGLWRAAATCAVLVALYFVLPLNSFASLPIVVELGIGIVILSVVVAWQLRAIIRAAYPAVRAIQALAMVVPLFLLLFAATYYTMARGSPTTFNEELTRSDALYFTVTVFSTVGFGDIVARAQAARLVVTVQILLDLAILGLGIRAVLGAVERGRTEADGEQSGSGAEPEHSLTD